ncbi:MAG TPA: helix-hairpin-helix domain-containing protein [Chitinophagaceae bacterium]
MNWWKDYLSFSRRERTAFIVFLVIVTGFIFLPDLIAPRNSATGIPEEVAVIMQEKRPGASSQQDGDGFARTTDIEKDAPVEMFTFDPNTLDSAGFVRLGLKPRTARTIINYRNKGGRFRSPSDLRKIYSLAEKDADRIIPYARVQPVRQPGQYNDYKPGTYHNRYQVPVIDINNASAEEWKALPGIGNVLSARIVRFRESLGGFSSLSQVAKTYGLPDSTFRKILPYLKITAPATNHIDINTAGETELMECPGMTTELAKAIIIRRKQKGNYRKTEDILEIVFVTEEMFRLVAPCLVVRLEKNEGR